MMMSTSFVSYAAWAAAGSAYIGNWISVSVGLTSPYQFGFGFRMIWLLWSHVSSMNGPELT